MASLISSLVMTMVLGSPVTRSLPLISADSSSSSLKGAAELDLELFGRLGADGELVLFLYVGGDRIVDVVAGNSDGGIGDDTS